MNPNNVDPKEIAKFDRLADDWRNPEGKMQPLHQLNPARLQYIEQHSTLAGKQVLDVGCGAGILTEALAKAGAATTGIDMSRAALNVARTHAQQSGLAIDYRETVIESLVCEPKNKTYDVVTCMEMLEHVPDPQKVIQACADIAKPGGLIFFSTLHRNPKSFFFAIVAAEYVLNLVPRGTHQYANFIKPSELNAWARSAQLKLIDMSGMSYSPFRKKVSLSKDLSINYLACYQKPLD